jgi:hypothetical protein
MLEAARLKQHLQSDGLPGLAQQDARSGPVLFREGLLDEQQGRKARNM